MKYASIRLRMNAEAHGGVAVRKLQRTRRRCMRYIRPQHRFQLSLAHAAASIVMGSGQAAFTLTDEWTSAMPVRSLSGTHAPDQDRSLMPKDRDKPNDPGAPFTSANGVRFGSRGTGAVDVDGRRHGGPSG